MWVVVGVVGVKMGGKGRDRGRGVVKGVEIVVVGVTVGEKGGKGEG